MSNNTQVGHGKLLYEELFYRMCADFVGWRMDAFIRQLEATKRKGRVLSFIRGLRLSAHLIYAIREILSGTDLEANWGHLLDKDEVFCSPECDVIIHHRGHIRRWNGTENPIMDFRFIEQEKAIAVISCKSKLESIDAKYCQSMRPFVKRIWLFAECCDPQQAENLQKRASRHGYENFWYLYGWTKDVEPDLNKNGWNEFVEEVKKLR